MMVVEQDIVIKNKLGLHARPASRFAQLACSFESDIKLMKNSIAVDGKSILEVLTLACPAGSHLKIIATGQDAKQAAEALGSLVASGFNECD